MLAGAYERREVVCTYIRVSLFLPPPPPRISQKILYETLYKVRYGSNANALLKDFDSWISLKILCSKVTALFAHLNEL